MPKPLNLIEENGLSDINDYETVVELNPGRTVVKAIPAPRDGAKINPHVSRFELDNGDIINIFHVKPIYYVNKQEEWRPMEEIADEFGNHYIKLKADWKSKVHPEYLRWLHKRMGLINAGKPEDLILERDEQEIPTKIVPQGLSEKVGQVYSRIPDAALEAMWRNPNF